MHPDKTPNRRVRFTLKLWGAALFLVACEPLIPTGNCDQYFKDCDKRAYGLLVNNRWDHAYRSAPVFTVDSLPLGIYAREMDSVGALTFKFSPGGGGRAYALSCASCEDFFEGDSIWFSTDIVSITGDTLKAGYNFAKLPLPLGFQGYGDWVQIDSLTGFRDTTFEVTFKGSIKGAEKMMRATLTNRIPALRLAP